jgi:hypothetical protein
MRPHTIVVVSIAVVFTVVVSTVVAIIVVFVLEWRWVLPSAPPPSVLLRPVLITRQVITRRAADTTLTHRATRTRNDGRNTIVEARNPRNAARLVDGNLSSLVGREEEGGANSRALDLGRDNPIYLKVGAFGLSRVHCAMPQA